MQPLLTCNNFSCYFIKARNYENVTDWFNCAFEAFAQACYGYEFIVRENVSRICLFLYSELNPQQDLQNVPLNQDNLRIRKMLAFIHKNYADPISVPEIAGTAGISEENACAVFKKQFSFPQFSI